MIACPGVCDDHHTMGDLTHRPPRQHEQMGVRPYPNLILASPSKAYREGHWLSPESRAPKLAHLDIKSSFLSDTRDV